MSLIKLQKLIDKAQQLDYHGQIAVIKSFDNKYGNYDIVVELDGKPTIFNKKDEESINLWLANFSSILKQEDEKNNTPATLSPKLPAKNSRNYEPTIYVENKEAHTNLSKLLLNDIEKVRADPGYVPQAKQICNSVNAIVNITRLQLQLLKIND